MTKRQHVEFGKRNPFDDSYQKKLPKKSKITLLAEERVSMNQTDYEQIEESARIMNVNVNDLSDEINNVLANKK